MILLFCISPVELLIALLIAPFPSCTGWMLMWSMFIAAIMHLVIAEDHIARCLSLQALNSGMSFASSYSVEVNNFKVNKMEQTYIFVIQFTLVFNNARSETILYLHKIPFSSRRNCFEMLFQLCQNSNP